MEELSPPSEERQWQLDSRAFLWAILCHWENLGTAVFGCAAISLWIGRGYVIAPSIFTILTALCFFIACFQAWRDERRAKEKALAVIKDSKKPPQIAGLWKRTTDPLSMLIKQNGTDVTCDFKHDGYDHKLTAYFDPETRKFMQQTFRADTRAGGKTTSMQGSIEPFKGGLLILTFNTDGGGLATSFNEVSFMKQMHQ